MTGSESSAFHPFVRQKEAKPFLVSGTKASGGSIRNARDQPANKAHDIVCSFDVQGSLHVLSMVVSIQGLVYFMLPSGHTPFSRVRTCYVQHDRHAIRNWDRSR